MPSISSRAAIVVDLGDPRREAKPEGLAGDGGAIEQRARLRVERAQLVGKRGGDRGRQLEAAFEHLGDSVPHLVRRRRAASELLDVKRVAPGGVEDRVPQARRDRVGEQLGGLLARERLEPDHRGAGVVTAGGEDVADASERLLGTVGGRDQRRTRGWSARERKEQLERGVVGPVKVVEREDEATAGREPAEKPGDGAVGEVALDDDLGLARLAQARKDRRQFWPVADPHAAQPRLVDCGQIRIEGVDED